jgi:hypothetical protein
MSGSAAHPGVPAEPRDAIAADIGKTILVGVKNYDAAGNLTSQSQHVGEVIAVAEDRITIRWAGGEITSLPPQVSDAPQGVYRLRSSGEEVVNPDLLATWRFDWTPPEGEAGPND